MHILLVEDDEVLREVLRRSLQDAGHRVDVATHLKEASRLWAMRVVDAVILDLNMPESGEPDSLMGSGLHVLQQMRAQRDPTPVLVLTAFNRTDERIAGLRAGADDYVGKPFDLAEVEARLQALVRRSRRLDERTLVGTLALDTRARQFYLRDKPLYMPAREFDVLWELMTQPGHVLSKQTLSAKLSELDEPLGDNALEAFISRLRKKIAGSGAAIRTLRGMGYLLEPSHE